MPAWLYIVISVLIALSSADVVNLQSTHDGVEANIFSSISKTQKLKIHPSMSYQTIWSLYIIDRVYMCYDVHHPAPPQHAPLVEAHHRYMYISQTYNYLPTDHGIGDL